MRHYGYSWDDKEVWSKEVLLEQEPPHESDMAPIQHMVPGSCQYEDTYHNCSRCSILDLALNYHEYLAEFEQTEPMLVVDYDYAVDT